MDPSELDPSLLGMHIAGDLGPLTLYQTKRGKVVAFPRAPPKSPPTAAQQLQRFRFRRTVETWHDLSDLQRDSYQQAVNACSLCMTGMNLWIHFCLCWNPAFFATVQRQAGLSLFPPPSL